MTKTNEELESLVYESLTEKECVSKNPGNVFISFLDRIAEFVLQEIDSDTAISEVLRRSARRILDTGVMKEILIKVSKRILIYDMNARREAGELAGQSEEEEYEDYVYCHLMQPEYLQNLFREYPVWKEVIFKV